MEKRRLFIVLVLVLGIMFGLVFGFWLCDKEHEKVYKVYEISLGLEENKK